MNHDIPSIQDVAEKYRRGENTGPNGFVLVRKNAEKNNELEAVNWHLDPQAKFYFPGDYKVDSAKLVSVATGGDMERGAARWAAILISCPMPVDPVPQVSKTVVQNILSGGELPPHLAGSFIAVRKRLQQQPDVLEVQALAETVDGRWLYLIKTPFVTYPKFVIGTTDADLQDVKLLFLCEQEWSASSEWDRLRRGPLNFTRK